jgi:hypothetical protein
VALPLIAPRRLYRFALWASTAIVASFVAVSILRLGILYAPTLGLQIGALSRYHRRIRPGSAAAT